MTVQHVEHAAEVTERLREDEPPLGLTLDEAVCPRCLMAYFVPAGSWGVCRDCLDEPLLALVV